MKGMAHKILGMLIFIILLFLGLLPGRIQEYTRAGFFNIILCTGAVFLFSGGRMANKKWFEFGLSPDNDYHEKAKRSWLFHSTLFPIIGVLFSAQPLILVSCFSYAFHVFLDLLNPRSWDGSRYTYFFVFLSTVLFFVILYK